MLMMYEPVGTEAVCRNRDIRNVLKWVQRAVFFIHLILSVKGTSLGTSNAGV
jgi:hypothetical protein